MQTKTPLLSVIVVVHRMVREAPRTLLSLTTQYQQDVKEDQYEVIVVENISDQMLSQNQVESCGSQFRYMRNTADTHSPTAAMNMGARAARGDFVTLMVDGARILSPRVLSYSLMATRLHADPVVATLGWHLGPKNQAHSIKEGYSADEEDRLLAQCSWEDDGYRLFAVSALAGSSAGGWFSPLAESNCLTVSRRRFEALAGFCEDFKSRGGGVVNLDFYERAVTSSECQLFILLGEGSFHQIHGGIATNRKDDGVIKEFFSEYERMRGRPYQIPKPAREPIFFGSIPKPAMRFLGASANGPRAEKTAVQRPAA